LIVLAEKLEENKKNLTKSFADYAGSQNADFAKAAPSEKFLADLNRSLAEFSSLPRCILTKRPDMALKQLRQSAQKLASGFLSLDDFMKAQLICQSFLSVQISKWFSANQRPALTEALMEFWFLFLNEAVQIYSKSTDRILQAKTRESAVLFHTIQSVATDLDLESLQSKVVFHASMLLRGKQIYLFIAGTKPGEHSPDKPRLLLKAWNRVGQTYGEYSLRFGEGPVGVAAETQTPVMDNDYVKSAFKLPFLGNSLRILAVPITFSNEILGVLLAAETRRSERFTASQKDLLLMYAQQIGVAFKNVLLFNDQTKIMHEMEEKNQMLESQADLILRKSAQMVVLNEVSQKINSSLELHEVLALLTRQAAESIGVNRCVVWLFDEKKVRLDAVHAFGLAPENLSEMYLHLADIRDSIFFKVLASLTPSLLKSGDDESLFKDLLHGRLSVKCLLAVPLILKDEAIGLLVVDDTREEHEFLDDEENLICSIANQTVVAIENALLYQKVKEQAITDGLTGVFNHRFFQLRLTDEFSHSKRYNTELGLIMLDIDHFKQYNDTYGHIAGDLALKEIAQLTRASVRENDIVSRYGGEEFAIILPMTNLEGTRIVAERIRQSVMDCKFLGDLSVPQVSITVSCGLSAFDKKMENREDLIREADSALYQAKESGRNQTIIYQFKKPEKE
jgi:diguanylate cyclase (GGDEF)-like protein